VPFTGDSPAALIDAHRTRHVDRPPSIPPRYWSVIERAIDKRPGCRYPDAGAMAEALLEARRARIRTTSCEPVSAGERLRELRRGIGAALRAGQVGRAGSRYLEEVSTMLTLGMRQRAVAELREAVAVVTGGHGAHSDAGPPVTARLLCRLAQLEREDGAVSASRGHARAALRRALLCGDRATELEARILVSGRTRLSDRSIRRLDATETAPM
jgi:hypothetical protein